MDARQWLVYLALAALLGACGQLARTVAGLRKLHEKRAEGTPGGEFDVKKLFVSIALGSVAGIFSAVALWKPEIGLAPIDREFLMAIIVSGYAGSDFIESFIEKAVAK